MASLSFVAVAIACFCYVTGTSSLARSTVQQDIHTEEDGRSEQQWGPGDHAGHARWLVHSADYAVISSHSTMQDGWPFGNVISISDGAAGNSTGRIIVYVATISQFVADVAADPRVAVAVSQAQADGGHGCVLMDPEWPLCARASIFGHAKVIPAAAAEDAAALMFARHPQMRAWSKLAHKWAFYEIHVSNARVLDFFGGFHEVSAKDYYDADPRQPLGNA